MWDFWKHLLASVIDKNAPFRTKRANNSVKKAKRKYFSKNLDANKNLAIN